MSVRALAFDVFGTVVDWRSTVIREGEALGRARGLQVDWAAFAEAWRDGYHPAMDRVRRGELPWKTMDELHRMNLDGVLERFGVDGLAESEKADFNRVWHRLDPWSDSVPGLTRLKAKFTVTTLSNGNVGLLVNMAKRAKLPWDLVLSSELIGHYKPDREVYLRAAALLGLAPGEVMIVAAHKYDLKAAAEAGLRTAFVPRPMEWAGPRDRSFLRGRLRRQREGLPGSGRAAGRVGAGRWRGVSATGAGFALPRGPHREDWAGRRPALRATGSG